MRHPATPWQFLHVCHAGPKAGIRASKNTQLADIKGHIIPLSPPLPPLLSLAVIFCSFPFLPFTSLHSISTCVAPFQWHGYLYIYRTFLHAMSLLEEGSP